MTITVNTPDGGTAAFPDGTDAGVITSAMKAKFGGPDSSPAAQSDDSTAGIIGNTAYRALNTGTLHAPDYLLAGLHSIERGTGYDPNATDLSQIRAENQDFAQKHPLLATGADVAGYAAPMLIPGYGEVSLAANAAKGAEALGAGARLAQGVGSGVEGATLSGLGTATSGGSAEDSLKAAATGGALSGVLGGVAAARAPIAGAPVAKSLNDLKAGEAAYYAHLDTLPVNPTIVNKAVSGAANTLKPSEISGLSDSFTGQLTDVMKQVNSGLPLTANDMNSMARQLSNAQRSPTDSIAGTKIGNVLQSFYSGAQADARMGSAKVKDMTWLTDPNLTPEEKIAQAQENIGNSKMLMDDPTKEAMTNLANAGPSNFTKGAQGVVGSVINRGAGAGLGYLTGGLLGHGELGAFAGQSGLGSGGLGGTIARNIPGLRSKAAVQRAIQAAQAATSTGQQALPGMYRSNPLLSQSARNVAVAGGLAGDY